MSSQPIQPSYQSQSDPEKLTNEDANNLTQFVVASVCQSEKIGYINQQSLDILSQVLIDEIMLLSRVANTATVNSDRTVTNTTDVAFALEAKDIPLPLITQYIINPTRDLFATTGTTLNDENQMDNDDDYNKQAPIPISLPKNNNSTAPQYQVNFDPIQARCGYESVQENILSNGTSSAHLITPHIPPYIPPPPTQSSQIGNINTATGSGVGNTFNDNNGQDVTQLVTVRHVEKRQRI